MFNSLTRENDDRPKRKLSFSLAFLTVRFSFFFFFLSLIRNIFVLVSLFYHLYYRTLTLPLVIFFRTFVWFVGTFAQGVGEFSNHLVSVDAVVELFLFLSFMKKYVILSSAVPFVQFSFPSV